MMLRGTSVPTNRRTFLAGSLAIATTATLAACGVGGSGSSGDGDSLTLLVEAGGTRVRHTPP